MNGFIFFDERNWISDFGLLIAVGCSCCGVGDTGFVDVVAFLYTTRMEGQVQSHREGRKG